MTVHIGHAHLKVRNLERSIDFYTQFLDLTIREQVDNRWAFLSGTDVHHELALQEVGADAPLPSRWHVGLFHIAFEVPTRMALARYFHRLVERDVPVVAVDHRISWAVYFGDPDGNGLELYCDTRGDDDGAERWEGVDRPLSAERLLAALGTAS